MCPVTGRSGYPRGMPRWEPGGRERLVVAAVDLFTEQGYDSTNSTINDLPQINPIGSQASAGT